MSVILRNEDLANGLHLKFLRNGPDILVGNVRDSFVLNVRDSFALNVRDIFVLNGPDSFGWWLRCKKDLSQVEVSDAR